MKTQVTEAIASLSSLFAQIDQQTQKHLQRVLDAFREHKVGVHHFASVSGYGHNELGRDTLDRVFAEIVGAQRAAVRVQLVSGTHAIACCLFGILRPGDELLSVTGTPYDTLQAVITRDRGCLTEFGIQYRELPLTEENTIDWQALETAVKPETRMVFIQRSCGYSWRASLSVREIARIVAVVKQQNANTICFVDNCYGEFVEDSEPTAVGADLMAGSMIKNPGGTIAPTGGYIAGKAELVEMAATRLTAPGIGTEGGSSLFQNRLLFQGLFLAPQMVGSALKCAHLAACVFSSMGYPVNPQPYVPRYDVIQAIKLGSPDKLLSFCRHLQKYSPVDSFVEPVPAVMPGYDCELVMGGGTFIDGSTAELSADAPLRPPYILYLQGGTHWTHLAIVLENLDEAEFSLLGGDQVSQSF
ncbi:MAG: aminotransferase class I/II-fold pyridoxal phosphate-dependent enzyme [Pseudanabaenaceae cyanobacterium]